MGLWSMVSAVKVRSHVSSKLFQDAAPLGDCEGSECGDGGGGGRRKGPEKRGECLRRGKKRERRKQEDKLRIRSPQGGSRVQREEKRRAAEKEQTCAQTCAVRNFVRKFCRRCVYGWILAPSG